MHIRLTRLIAKERRPNGLLDINIAELQANPRLALSRIMGPLNIADKMAKTATRNKLILLLSRNISQTVGAKGGDVIRQTYPSVKQYMVFPETKEGQEDLNTFTRRMDGLGSWEMVKISVLLLIEPCIRKGRKLRIKRNSAIPTVTFKSCFKNYPNLGARKARVISTFAY